MIKRLAACDAQRVASGCNVTSVSVVVKELLENSLDAGARIIAVKLYNGGLDRIVVQDNGGGIDAASLPYLGQRHHTSKIGDFADLSMLQTYGFRGEALHSLCQFADVTVQTRQRDSREGRVVTFDNSGAVATNTPSPYCPVGTSVTVQHLFKALPVRLQEASRPGKQKQQYLTLIHTCLAYSIIHPDVKVSLFSDDVPSREVQKSAPCANLAGSVQGVLGPTAKHLRHIHAADTVHNIQLDLFVPDPTADYSAVSRSCTDRVFLFCNSRPFDSKRMLKAVRNAMAPMVPDGAAGRYPVVVLALEVPLDQLDVNCTPDKRTVGFTQEEVVLNLLNDALLAVYRPAPLLPPSPSIGDPSSDTSGDAATTAMPPSPDPRPPPAPTSPLPAMPVSPVRPDPDAACLPEPPLGTDGSLTPLPGPPSSLLGPTPLDLSARPALEQRGGLAAETPGSAGAGREAVAPDRCPSPPRSHECCPDDPGLGHAPAHPLASGGPPAAEAEVEVEARPGPGAGPPSPRKRPRDAAGGGPLRGDGGAPLPKVRCAVADIVDFKGRHPADTYYPLDFDFPSAGGCSQHPRVGQHDTVAQAAPPHVPGGPVDLAALRVCCPLPHDLAGLWVVTVDGTAAAAGEAVSSAWHVYVLDVNAAERQVLTSKLSAAFDMQPQPLARAVDLHTWCGDGPGERFSAAEMGVLALAQESPPVGHCLRMNGFHVTAEGEAGQRHFWLAGAAQTLGIADFGPLDLLLVCRALAAYLQTTEHDGVAQVPERIPLQCCRSPRALAFFAEQARRLVDRHRDQPRTAADVQMVVTALAAAPPAEPCPLALLHTVLPRPPCG